MPRQLDDLRWATEAEADAAAAALNASGWQPAVWFLAARQHGDGSDPQLPHVVVCVREDDAFFGLTRDDIDKLPPEPEDRAHLRLVHKEKAE